MAKTLIIVESPAKAKTIGKFLGKDYVVESSIGHIRDLPKNASEIPERYRGLPWARLGLDVEHDFAPLYVVPADKRPQVAKLRGLVKAATEVVLATDDDREGESIAWHLRDELRPRVPVRRMVFHEITHDAIQAAIASPRDINESLVQAQETRRALDRLYGFEVSPVLWKKVQPKLSAGRVQSVATRMLVERERERMRFVPGSWWDLEATFLTAAGERFSAGLIELAGRRLAAGRDFDPLTGKLKPDAAVVQLDEPATRELAGALAGAAFRVLSTEERPFTQRPYAPFITSTLQQEGGRKLGFSSQRTMRTAQRLYEGGYITYMRTDSTTLSREATEAARKQVRDLYGNDYLHPTPRTYEKKAKNAQEAHEAIRPAGDAFRKPDGVRAELDDDAFRLYDLIWKRTVASQMADARGRRLQVRVGGTASGGREAVFAASGKTIDFPGFLRAYVEGADDPDAALEDREVVLPPLAERDPLTGERLEPKGHATQPPARFTEASLVQALEAAGIGRPSTYASIITTIQDRGYAFKKGTALSPTFTAFATVGLLEQFFGELVDYDFTARMEEDLDDIAAGRGGRGPYLQRFYFGTEPGAAARGPDDGPANPGLKRLIETRLEDIDARAIATIAVPRLAGSGIEVRVGRFGTFLKRDETTANVPDELAPDELTLEKAEELLGRPSGERPLGTDPATGLAVVARNGRYGPYVQLGEPGSKTARSASLFPTDSVDDLVLERALRLLSLPRTIGVLDGEEVQALNGRYGPYITRDGDSRSLERHEDLFTIDLEAARALFAQPKARRAAKGPLQRFEYPDRAPIELRDGRFAPYLSDGEVNASLRAGEDPASLGADRAREILAERGKPPKGKPARAKKASKTGKAAPEKATRPARAARPTKAGPARAAKPKAARKPAKPAPSRAKRPAAAAKAEAAPPRWDELAPFAATFDPTTAELLRLVNGEGQRLGVAASRLRITPEDALARYRASNFKLYSLYRKAKTAENPRPESKAGVGWTDLRRHLGRLDPTERRLIEAVRDEGRKVEDVAPDLGLDVKKARGMVLQISKKLNQAHRGSAGD